MIEQENTQQPTENGKKTGGRNLPPVEHQFKPGNPGGPGVPKGKRWSTVISELLGRQPSKEAIEKIEAALGKGAGSDFRNAIIAKQIQIALGSGKDKPSPTEVTRAAQFLADREEGKAVQPVDLSGSLNINFDELTEEQLRRIAAGENPVNVVGNIQANPSTDSSESGAGTEETEEGAG